LGERVGYNKKNLWTIIFVSLLLSRKEKPWRNGRKRGREWATEEREYLKTHLVGMDDTKKRWYFNTMKTWTKKDYDHYDRFQMWMIFGAGSLPEEEENEETSKEPEKGPRSGLEGEDR